MAHLPEPEWVITGCEAAEPGMRKSRSMVMQMHPGNDCDEFMNCSLRRLGFLHGWFERVAPSFCSARFFSPPVSPPPFPSSLLRLCLSQGIAANCVSLFSFF
ncbi:hypothetical protein M758_8G133800 [Ceratodon purpureus]|nr:hypothetical protein M758_8G133800 [Ceratodon purpureus]